MANLRRPASWLVLLAFLIATLAPSLGLALGGHSTTRTIWAQLCSVDGPALVAIQIDAQADQDTKTDDARQGHCLLCFHPSSTPQDPVLAPVAAASFARRIPATGHTTSTRHSPTWHVPPARAPPISS